MWYHRHLLQVQGGWQYSVVHDPARCCIVYEVNLRNILFGELIDFIHYICTYDNNLKICAVRQLIEKRNHRSGVTSCVVSITGVHIGTKHNNVI